MKFTLFDFIRWLIVSLIDVWTGKAQEGVSENEYHEYIRMLIACDPSISVEYHTKLMELRFPPKTEPIGFYWFITQILLVFRLLVDPYHCLDIRCLSPYWPQPAEWDEPNEPNETNESNRVVIGESANQTMVA